RSFRAESGNPVNQNRRNSARYLDSARHAALVKRRSDGAGFFERLVSAPLVYCLETACREANTHKLLQLRHPNTLALQIVRENARHHFRDVPAHATFLLGQTASVNHAASHRSGSCDMSNFHFAKKAA